jgi:hypothetical protein
MSDREDMHLSFLLTTLATVGIVIRLAWEFIYQSYISDFIGLHLL